MFLRRRFVAGNMFKFITFLGLALMASGVVGGPGLVVKFLDLGLSMGTTFFIPLPTTTTAAVKEGYEECDRPYPEDRSNLTMYCKTGNRTFSLLFDDNGNVGGLQIAIKQSSFTNSTFDLTVQGLREWTIDSTKYWVVYQYFMTKEYLALSKEERASSYDTDNLIQGDYCSFSHFNGGLIDVPLTDTEILKTGYTRQSCIPWMGHHFYWNMSSTTECASDKIAINFPLVKSGKIIGSGMNFFGEHILESGKTDYFEHPAVLAVKAIVSSGPACLYKIAEILFTMHVYFIDDPQWITCIFQ